MRLTIDQALKKGIDAHKAGQVQDADRYYTAILKANPKHPEANHNMGVLAVGVQKVEHALQYFITALEADPNITQFWISYFDALIKLDRMDEAKEVINRATEAGVREEILNELDKRLNTTFVEGTSKSDTTQDPSPNKLYSLAKLYSQKKFQQVFEQTRILIKRYPNNPVLLNLMGVSAAKLERLDDAVLAFKKVIKFNPDSPEAYNNMGIVFREQKKLKEATEAFSTALSMRPNYADAYKNTSELLKIYSPKSKMSHILFKIDNKIKNLSPRLLSAETKTEINDSILEGLNYINDDEYKYKTSLSQIYKRNRINLNCKRHKKIFNTEHIIPEFCFGCFKLQVDVRQFIDLIKVTSLFYKSDFDEALTKKTMIELRPNISGYYKGLIYCNSLDQAQAVKTLLDNSLKQIFGENATSKIKRGCSEYVLRYPNYGTIAKKQNEMMSFPKEWKPFEEKFDQDELIEPNGIMHESLSDFCLSDFYIIQKWIDYAKGIGDQSVKIFNNMPIVHRNIYELAKIRARSQCCN